MSATTPAYPDYGQPLWKRVLLTREMAIVALLLVTILVAALTVPYFADRMTAYNLLRNMFATLMIALPMALVMITGDIDISVGSMVGLTCSLLGLLYASGVPFELAMVLVLIVGAAGGLLNGLLVTRIGLPALAVTIGTMALFRGIAVGLLGTSTVTEFPEAWTNLAKYEIGTTGIPFIIVFYLVLLAAFIYLLHFTSFGRGVYAIGLNAEAAAFSGVNGARTRTILFMLAGTISGLGGIYWTLLRGTARGDVGDGLELQVIAAVVLGGVSVFGGVGAIYGVVAGVLLIGVLSSALQLVGVTAEVIKIITGVLLIGSVVLASFITWVKDRRARPALAAPAASPAVGG
ncbi:MAG: ABC transporter permease [Propionicimonas sp.]|uniref:ABC transporter permease n=1 Tax=Propionicimonas sp. TaxID=1955623 RepID=UPI002B21DC1C|nr:ABC transporter permease [Propionicimonas sp.]MEA4945071.1 ABC transporter permease [Propionicimonas sp.]MEA5053048.1 ABC transporter permease [Propionicimonas sp.]MEA5118578.1 ABC transporter permease [Propionicimonas sp.]